MGLAVLAILVRLSFLRRGEAFFNADEAVEGLIARHIGEWPVLFWGQGYKGVPEAYLSALVFAVFGTGVVQLKAVSLGIWATAVGVWTRVGQRALGDAAGAFIGGLLGVGTPSVIAWSLTGQAEAAWIALVTGLVVLAYDRSCDSGGRLHPFVPLGCGLALWIHPLALGFVTAIALIAAQRSPWWRAHGWRGVVDVLCARDARGVMRLAILVGHAAAAALLLAFVWTFFGLRVSLGPLTASHPQKEFRLLIGVGGLTVVLHALAGGLVARGRALVTLGWCALGLAPVAVFVLRGGGLGALISVHRIGDIPPLLNTFVTFSLPMWIGVRDQTTAWAGAWWEAAPFLILLSAGVGAGTRLLWTSLHREPWRPSSAAPLVTAGVLSILLGPGGAFTDLSSYRYLMPYWALAAFVAGAGLRIIERGSRPAAAWLAVVCLAAFVHWDVTWWHGLGRDDSPARIIACLRANGVHAATADYWIAYRLTFLANEDPVVDAEPGSRYPPYAAAARAAPLRVVIRAAGSEAVRGTTICTSQSLLAVVPETAR